MDAVKQPVRGFAGLWDILPDGRWVQHARNHNSLMVEWGMAAARLFGFGDRTYQINRMYVEFENVASPSDTVTPPSFDMFSLRHDYYDSLAAPRDYLRVPLEGAPKLYIGTGYENYFIDGETGNALLFRAVTQGSIGIHGLPFSNGANSKVYGLALVAAPVDGDVTQDILVSRAYYTSDQQKLKPSSGEVGLSWDLIFEPVA